MVNDIASLLFPKVPRNFPFRRTVRTGLRTVHILTSGVLLGGYIFNQPTAELEPWLLATVISGILMLATDVHASAAVLIELRGLAVVIKLVLLALVPVFWDARIALLLASLVIGSIISHMPKRYRHKVLFFHRKIVPDERHG
jgi:multisubunit Na+/H+ antiporter MnhB subunit